MLFLFLLTASSLLRVQAEDIFKDEPLLKPSPSHLLFPADFESEGEKAPSLASLWPFKASHGPLLASRGPLAPVDVFILYPPPTSRPDVRL